MTDLNATWNEALRGPRMSETTGKVIFKYQMPIKEVFHVDLPKGAQIIRVADLDGMFWLWAIVDTNAPMEKRFFRAFKTGAKIPDDFDTSHYLGMCAVFIQMELGLYIFEDVKRYEDEQAYNFTVNAAINGASREELFDGRLTKSRIAKIFGRKNNIPVVDVKMSTVEAGDMIGMPETEVKPFKDYVKDGPSGEFFDWGSFSSDLLGYNIYKKPPVGTKARFIMDIDEVLLEFEDVLRPLFEAQNRKPLNQNKIDEIEAQGGFEEEEA